LLVFNVKVKQFDFLCPLYLHIKTTPFYTPNFSTHSTQNDTILSIKIIYFLKKNSKIQKKKKKKESWWLQPPLGQNGVAGPPHFWSRGGRTTPMAKGHPKKENPRA
jgi:hypothetical protein